MVFTKSAGLAAILDKTAPQVMDFLAIYKPKTANQSYPLRSKQIRHQINQT